MTDSLSFNMEYIQPKDGAYVERFIDLGRPDHKQFFYRTLEWAIRKNVDVRIRPMKAPVRRMNDHDAEAAIHI